MAQSPYIPHIQRIGRMQAESFNLSDIEAELGRPVYRMCYNENPLGPSPDVIAAIQHAARNLGQYPDWTDAQLRQALAEVIGRDLTPDHFFSANSGSEVLELVARAFLREGDEYILSTPTFSTVYNRIGNWQGGVAVDVPLAPQTFAYDVAGVLAAITDRTRLIMLCNPNNPTGTLITEAEMAHLVAQIPEHVIVVADEVYAHFVDDPDFPDSLGHVQQGKNVVIVHSFSKAYGLAGLRVGYGIARPELANYIAGLVKPAHLDSLSLAGAIAACRDQAYFAESVAYLINEKRWLQQQLDRLDVRYWPAAANFILAETRLPTEVLAARVREHGVLIRAQNPAELPYAVRISVGTREANQALIHALETILQESE